MTTEEANLEREREREFVFKVVILGDAAVGKTSLINQFVEGSFQEDVPVNRGRGDKEEGTEGTLD